MNPVILNLAPLIMGYLIKNISPGLISAVVEKVKVSVATSETRVDDLVLETLTNIPADRRNAVLVPAVDAVAEFVKLSPTKFDDALLPLLAAFRAALVSSN